MKKTLILLAFFTCLILTGCAKNKTIIEKNISETITLDDTGASLICSSDHDYSELHYSIGSKHAVYVDENKKISKVISTEIITSTDNNKLDEFENYLNENHSVASQYGGYNFELKHEKNKIISKVAIDYNEFDLEKFLKDNDTIYKKSSDFNLDNVEQQYIDLGAKCTRK